MGAIDIIEPVAPDAIDQVRALFREFIAWHRAHHSEDADLIDRYFDESAFEAELSSLPGKYGPPDGALLLARLDGAPAGCVALRRLDDDCCEMKRMFVPPELHGRGVGRSLAREVIARARALGYRRMLLDTSVRQVAAISLYESVGFARIPPYYELPDELRSWLVFMALQL